MDERKEPGDPMFDWLPIDQIFMYFDPDKDWERMWASNREFGNVLKDAVRESIKSLEGLSSTRALEVQKILKDGPDLWNWVVDWWYCKESFERIVPIKERFFRLDPVPIRVTESKEVNVYLREATRCFLYGFFQASTTLFRSALEAGLKDACERKLLAKPLSSELVDLINQAARFHWLPNKLASDAHRVREIANRAIHDEPVDQEKAFAVLVATRMVLRELYKS